MKNHKIICVKIAKGDFKFCIISGFLLVTNMYLRLLCPLAFGDVDMLVLEFQLVSQLVS